MLNVYAGSALVRLVWATAGFCLLLSGCSGGAPLQADPATLSAETRPVDEYLIGPGDRLEVFVWRQPELSVEVPVRPDGRISTPLVDDLVAVGKTPTLLAEEIRDVLSEYIRSPEVNVIVRDFVGTFGNQIRVLGEVAEPRSIAYRERMTVLDVVIEVGGLTDFAAGNRSRIIRSRNGQSQEIRVRLDELVSRGRIEHNIPVQPGDVLIIPRSVF